MLAEFFSQAQSQFLLIAYVVTLFFLTVGGIVVGTLLKRRWLSLPYCQRCWRKRVLPGRQLCLSCRLETH